MVVKTGSTLNFDIGNRSCYIKLIPKYLSSTK